MAIDPLSEELLTFSQAAKRLPKLRSGRPVAPSTFWRWATAGLRGARLETVKVGGATCTSADALKRFFAKLNGQPTRAPAARKPGQDEAVERQLAARGI
jgi:hypothetical protein